MPSRNSLKHHFHCTQMATHPVTIIISVIDSKIIRQEIAIN